MKAASIAWLKEFWKLGTGTRSELSLSPSLSTGAGGTKLFSSEKNTSVIFLETTQELLLTGVKPAFTKQALLTLLWSSFGPHICFCFSNPQHLRMWQGGDKNLSIRSRCPP
jgi:hypothetical protein